MCIRVDANGYLGAAGTHVSVAIYNSKGKYDKNLFWPLQGTFTIQLVNHKNQDHREVTVTYNDPAVADGSSSHKVATGETIGRGWGYSRFISHSSVESTETKQYIIDDCLTFRVTNIVMFKY